MKFILCLLLSFSAYAKESRVYSFGELMVAFDEVDGFIVNRACADKKCQAYKKAKKYKSRIVPSKLLDGGKNPESVRCKSMMDGKVVIGTDLEGHEQSFCLFKDDSYLL